ncbi:MAG TPA: HigA family addiction module antitoxin [Hyphomicrobium sp.]
MRGRASLARHFCDGSRKNFGVSRQALHRVLAATSSISAEMALRNGKFCGNGPLVWIRMQAAYDLWRAEQRVGRR